MAHIGASFLQSELGTMELTVKELQMEIASLKHDRMELHKKSPDQHELGDRFSSGPPSTYIPEISTWNTTRMADEEHNQLSKYENKLKELEMNLKAMCDKNKDIKSVFEVERDSLNQQLRDVREELDDTKHTLNEKTEELHDYRFKYLRAEQRAEELKRQIDVIELDNKQVTDQIHMEIHKMKLQFQEKLQELSPLPDVLKCTKLQLQEARELQHYFEQSAQALGQELRDAQEKLLISATELSKEKREKIDMEERHRQIQENLNKHVESMGQELGELRSELNRLEELRSQTEQKLQDKTKEAEQLESQTQKMHEDYNRSLSVQRDRADSMRRSYQLQLSDLETQLIRSRALCSAVHKERDEMRQGLMQQVSTATENFDLAEVRLKGLQAQVAMLKSKCSLTTNRYALDDEEDMH